MASSSIARDEAPIGVVIVHGIGNQRSGVLGRSMADRLEHSSGHPDNVANFPRDPVQNENREETTATTPIVRITIGDAPVLVREAHWASLSHPDNPPQVRLAPYLLLDLVDTVSRAWYASAPATAIRRLSGGVTPALSLIGGGIFTTVFIALAFAAALAADQSDTGYSVYLVAAGIMFALLLPILFYQMYRSLRNRYLRTRHAGKLKRVVNVVLWVPIAFVVGWIQVVLVLLSAELPVFLFLVMLVAVALDFIVYPLTRAFTGTGRIMGQLRLKGVQRWIHRLGWVTVVMPVHSLLQSVKATGTLVSVLFTERDLVPRSATVLWFVAVYVGFIVLLVFSELLIIPPILPLFESEMTVGEGAVVSLALLPVYLGIVKVSLPIIDLILDIGNYHLARAEVRGEYFERIEESMRSLVDAGCREIHILAHSLGSVISYDWLASPRADGYPVTVLHTIGSPLNKFWYLDHGLSARLTDRQGLPRLGGRWINYWAWSDIISGRLARFGTDAGGISNTRLRWLGIALDSHRRYWKNAVVLAGVRHEIERSFQERPM